MTLLEFAELTSPVPLSAWQQSFLESYQQAVKDGMELICIPGRVNGQQMVKDIMDEYYHGELREVRCQKCGRLLGKLPPNIPHEIVCPKCKTINKQ